MMFLWFLFTVYSQMKSSESRRQKFKSKIKSKLKSKTKRMKLSKAKSNQKKVTSSDSFMNFTDLQRKFEEDLSLTHKHEPDSAARNVQDTQQPQSSNTNYDIIDKLFDEI